MGRLKKPLAIDHMIEPRKPEQTDLDREQRAWDMRKNFFSVSTIAFKMGTSEREVYILLSKATERFSKAFMEDVRRVKLEQVAQLEKIIRDTWKAWKKDLQTSRQGDRTKNHHYLNTLLSAMADVRKIMGIKDLAPDDRPADDAAAIQDIAAFVRREPASRALDILELARERATKASAERD